MMKKLYTYKIEQLITKIIINNYVLNKNSINILEISLSSNGVITIIYESGGLKTYSSYSKHYNAETFHKLKNIFELLKLNSGVIRFE